jgi:putative iron-regulated protein
MTFKVFSDFLNDRIPAIGFLLFSSLPIACSNDKAPGTPLSVEPVLESYSANLFAAYSDALNDQQAFSQKVEQFLASPDEASLTEVRAAWLASREHYMLTEGARFYGGPVDADPPNHEAALNAWPLDEAYIDYSTDATGAVDETVGLVNHPDILPAITVEALDALNAQGGDENVSNGYHAVEFLLWGRALTDIGPGKRPATDFVAGGPRKNADRRATYLRVAVMGIGQHLGAIRDAWSPGATYRSTFVAGGMSSVALALTGLGKMSKGELAGQRMSAAYASKSRRDQHDCFSSNTLVDYARDAHGIQAMYLGNYGSNDGPGFDELVRAKAPELDARIQKQLQASVDAIEAIPQPFEASIAGDDASAGRTAVRAAVASLRAQGDLFAEAAHALGLTIQTPDEPQ